MSTLQHDHHCIIVVHGIPRKIAQVSGPFIVYASCAHGCCRDAIDTTGMDFDAYCEVAAMNDFANAARAARGLPVDIRSEARN